jgi:hypothetical protein
MWHAWDRYVYRVLTGEREENRPISRNRWKGNIKMVPKEI